MKRKVILITDGDQVAREAVEMVARQVGGRSISSSAGNPTPLSGEQLVDRILQAKHDPVLVMFDDCGSGGEGWGERAMEYVANHPQVEVLGAVAVASNHRAGDAVRVDILLDRNGNQVFQGVDKGGLEMEGEPPMIRGDTVGVLNRIQVPLIVGIGDIGKMGHFDDVRQGAPVTRKAVELILANAGGSG
ncbi:MAG: stage V sporulation protein AE [Planifilum sp.]|jgi:stage V sporulation protein AE